MFGKITSQKSAKTRFLYSHEYRDQKMGEKTKILIFTETRKVREKNVGKKSSKKSAKTRFLYLHVYIVNKKLGGKKRETIFP